MPFNTRTFHSARYNDVPALTHSANFGTLDVSRSSLFGGASGFSLDLNMSVNAARAYMPLNMTNIAPGTPGIIAVSLRAGLNNAPTAAAGLLYGSVGVISQGGRRYAVINTDRTISFRDRVDTVLGTTTSLVPTSGAPLDLTVIYDGLTLPTVWLHVYVGTTLELSFNTHRAWADMFTHDERLYAGEFLPAGTNYGCRLYIADAACRESTLASDAPHLVAYPILRADGCMVPTAAGTYNQWTNQSSVAGTFADVDEAPHNGDTDFWQSTTTNHKHTVLATGANPIPVGATIADRGVQMRGVARLTDGAKVQPLWLLRLGTSEQASSLEVSPGTSYNGVFGGVIPRPGGGAWTRDDIRDCEFGVQSASVDPGARLTSMMGLEALYWTATLPLAATPVTAPRQGGMIGMSPGIF